MHSLLQCVWSHSMKSTSSQNEYRIQALGDYVYICRGLYLHSIVKLGGYSQKMKGDAQIQQQLSQKYKTDKSDRRCFCFCTKYYTCTTTYKGNKHERKHSHHKLWVCEIQKNSSILSSDSFNVSKLHLYNFSYKKT